MIRILWQYEIKPECRQDFETTYGPTGEWAQLFAKSTDYQGTTLFQQSDNPMNYLTIDCWQNKDSLANFKQAYPEGYTALDTRCEAFTVSEKLLGIYDE